MQIQPKKPISDLNLASLIGKIDRFGQDFLGVFLILVGLLSFLGLFRISTGFIIDRWTGLIERGFGWGAYLAAGLTIYFGLLILLRRIENAPHLNLNRILALEGFLFTFLILLAIFGGFSLDNAEIGADGGVIGWGLSRMIDKVLPVPFSTILFFVLAVVLLIAGFGYWKKILHILHLENVRFFSSGGGDQSITGSQIFNASLPPEDQNSDPASVGSEVQTDSTLNPTTQKKRRRINRDGLPPVSLLLPGEKSQVDKEFLQSQGRKIIKTLSEFNVPVKVMGYRIGPTIIQYAVELGSYDKVDDNGTLVHKRVQMAQLTRLKKDLTLALAVERLRFETPIPGYSYIGIEVPNLFGSKVRIRPILESNEYLSLKSPLGLVLGVDVSNQPVLADLSRMPHLLIGGTTGSGKSIFMRDLAITLIMRNMPEDLRLILLDPKKVELVSFAGIPHLLGSVETEPKRMIAALQWCVLEMERRFKLMESFNARDLNSFNLKMKDRGEEILPRIVIMVDELADLMANEPDQAEATIARLSQMARATGIHLVVSTQRPSVNVVTGLIKANFPARIAFVTATQVDSKVILDKAGAEDLLGKGDLLFLNPEQTELQRAQAPLVEKTEIQKVVEYWTAQELTDPQAAPWENIATQESEISDDLLEKALSVIQDEGKVSTSLLQLRLHIGFPKAGRLMDELKAKGYIPASENNGNKYSGSSSGNVNGDY
jgi:DNA segregation ATPase FtsK/SpoIIIE, S-DNA-T family